MPQSKKLTSLQRRWAELVTIRGLNGVAALRELGWPGKRPDDKAAKIRHLPQVQAYIARLEANAMASAGVSHTEIVMHLARIARFDPRQLEHPDGRPKRLGELDDDTAGAIASVDFEEQIGAQEGAQLTRVTKLRAWNKNQALSELGQIAGLKRQQLEVSGGAIVRVIDLTGAKKDVPQDE